MDPLVYSVACGGTLLLLMLAIACFVALLFYWRDWGVALTLLGSVFLALSLWGIWTLYWNTPTPAAPVARSAAGVSLIHKIYFVGIFCYIILYVFY